VKLVEGTAVLHCMPSRYHFAFFKLVGYLRLRRVRPASPADRLLSLHPHQSAAETYGISLWVLLTTSVFVTRWLTEHVGLPLWLAIVICVPVSAFLLQALSVGVGIITPFLRRLVRRAGDQNIGFNSFVIMTLLTITSAAEATQRTWARFAAWQFLAALGINALAAILVTALNGEITRLENSMGGTASESSSLLSH
jgi:hypothetical protein